ncbi:hypothetical protein HYPSUDRAFT_763421 [Hypholoma sublateritium FD-334 SS-4]|uniref:Nephrocystin 3-like N-terminal domain-containing protein n=1 Tax=Hypholoma sublateritium (strain FD-334 SS-4) TaxID=945553 RepID=A0A0D2NWQ2_HYPSF|nr:hypothetical protein HYPSUDRAFT_763421 [Hypholoma sublateritium FD-334 SS-4]
MGKKRRGRGPRAQQHPGGFFEQANNTVINGGTFTSVNSSVHTQRNGFDILQEHVAATAFHNSKQRLDPPHCQENTRRAVLEHLFGWIVGNVPRSTWIAWLNGAAGSGKSAICQSITEMCIQHGVKVVSFFFFRTDSTRNTIDPLVATLAYQIIQLLPETKVDITQSIESNPLIFEQSLETQLEVLIAAPLRHLRMRDASWQLFLVLDGVDECDGIENQRNLIRAISRLLLPKDLPLGALFGTRRENPILMAFTSLEVDENLYQLSLDNHYQTEEDICPFLNDSFPEIKRTHPFRQRLPPDWPVPAHIQEIIEKSSGQFIYASVVIHFLADPSSNPITQLDIVRGIRASGRATPFAQLDALYHHLFSQINDLPFALDLLAYAIFGSRKIADLKLIFQVTEDDIQSLLAPLTAVLFCDLENDLIVFRHASLPDFLCDKKRSQECCISTFGTRLSTLWFATAASGRFKNLPKENQAWHIISLLTQAEASAELLASVEAYTPSQTHSAFGLSFFAKHFLTTVGFLDFGDDGRTYDTFLREIVRYTKEEFPENLTYLENEHEISEKIAQMQYKQGQKATEEYTVGIRKLAWH